LARLGTRCGVRLVRLDPPAVGTPACGAPPCIWTFLSSLGKNTFFSSVIGGEL